MFNEIFVVVDTSRSMRKSSSLSAEQAVIKKLHKELISSPKDPFFKKITYYRCGDDKLVVQGNTLWVPAYVDCAKTAPIISSLKTTVFDALLSSQGQKRAVIVLSDGFWCGKREDLIEFEFSCYAQMPGRVLIAEINLGGNTLYNLKHPKSLKLQGDRDDLAEIIETAVKNM